MKATLFLLMLLCSPACADDEVWATEDCKGILISKDDGFHYQRAGSESLICQVAFWPLDSPVAEMDCGSGQKHEMVSLNDGTVIWDGVKMNAYQGPLPCKMSFTLPPNGPGSWVAVNGGRRLELDKFGSFVYSGENPSFSTRCAFSHQMDLTFDYVVACENGTEGRMEFYDTGFMQFDGTRFKSAAR